MPGWLSTNFYEHIFFSISLSSGGDHLKFLEVIKAADAHKMKNEQKKITVNIGQVMFSGEIYYY